jgi:hypothetical protein
MTLDAVVQPTPVREVADEAERVLKMVQTGAQ